jgi:hypothetical protein
LARLPGESPCFSRVKITQSFILNRFESAGIVVSVRPSALGWHWENLWELVFRDCYPLVFEV